MKKLGLFMVILLLGLAGYSQVTTVKEFRIANATTEFGENLPVGTKVYDIDANKYYVATAGVVSTATLTTASASFTLLNASATDDQTASEVNITDSGDNYTATNVEGALAEIANAGYLTSETDGDATNEIQTLDVAQLSGTKLQLSLSSDGEATHEIELSSLQDGTGTDDQTAAEVSIADAGGIITATDVEGALQENRTAIDLNTAKETNVSTSLSTGTVNGTTYGITSDGGADDVVLAAATNTSAGVMTAAQVTKLEGVATGAQVNYTWVTQTFTEDDGTPTAHALTYVAITDGCTVSVNGSVLSASNYTLTTSSLTLTGVPVLQYDQVVITYRTTGATN